MTVSVIVELGSFEDRVLCTVHNDAQDLYRSEAKAALDGLKPYFLRDPKAKPFDAGAWLLQHSGAILHALDFAEIYGRPERLPMEER